MCKVENCKRDKLAAKGLCWPHYQRWRRNGFGDIPVTNPIRTYKKRVAA